jgi:hypothetical protein
MSEQLPSCKCNSRAQTRLSGRQKTSYNCLLDEIGDWGFCTKPDLLPGRDYPVRPSQGGFLKKPGRPTD